MARVIVSAGHTNNDPGTNANGLKEVELNRAIAKKLVAQLRANGIITLSVPPNMDLQKRIEWINGTGYKSDFDDIAIEIHINDGGKSGFEFWYEGQGNNTSQKLAETIMQNVTSKTGLPSQGAKSEFEHEYKSLAFLNKTNTNSVLLECLYIDNKEDADKLKDEKELDKIAKGIAEGVCKHLNIEYIEAESPKTSTVAKPIENKPVTPQASVQQPQQRPPVPQMSNVPTQNPAMNNRPVFNKGFDDDDGEDFYMPNNMSRPQPMNNFQGFDAYPPIANNYSPAGFGNNNMPPMQNQMSREERKEMISKLYKKLLGREPNQNDLNYFLNIAITEDKLIKRMVDSQEHLDLVNSKIENEKNKEFFEKQKVELSRLKAENNDQKVLLQNLSKLLHQKNRHLSEMQAKVNKYEPIGRGPKKIDAEAEKVKYKTKLSDRFFHFLSSFLG
jgi:N-acetylmuramoyl-L-alanine amidase